MPKPLRKGKKGKTNDKASRKLARAIVSKQKAVVDEIIARLARAKIKAFDIEADGYPDGMRLLTWYVASNCDLPLLNIKQALQAFKAKYGVLPTRVGLDPKHRKVHMWHPKLVLEIDCTLPEVLATSPFARAILKRVNERKAEAGR